MPTQRPRRDGGVIKVIFGKVIFLLGLGMLSGRVLDEARVKKCVTVMLMFSGAALILR